MKTKKKKNILILGTIPPPIGGVTIHISRLLDYLERANFKFIFVELRKQKSTTICKYILNSKIIHLHISNPILKFFLSVFTFLSFKKLIITYHGNLGRYSRILNFFDYLSVLFCTYPIVLNRNSYNLAKTFNKCTKLFTSFIPPNSELIDLKTKKLLSEFIDTKKIIFCTNAFGVSYDKNKNEIYGINDLVKIFNSLSNQQLIISDPSGKYKSYISLKQDISSNILFINYSHDFIQVIKQTDCFIRATTTDGDSLSVKEALFYGKTVIASDCVSRPQNVLLYETSNWENLKHTIINYKPSPLTMYNIENGAEQLILLYKSIK
jgi:glycosyltransferase involved in cell wall biosynthesis